MIAGLANTDVSVSCLSKAVEVVDGKTIDPEVPTTSTNRAGENGPFEGRCCEEECLGC